MVDSTVGGVKAALKRARTKLATASLQPRPSRIARPEIRRVMRLYVERFNRRDWDGVRELISADARLTVADRFAGKFGEAPYFFNYDRWPIQLLDPLAREEGNDFVSSVNELRTVPPSRIDRVCQSYFPGVTTVPAILGEAHLLNRTLVGKRK